MEEFDKLLLQIEVRTMTTNHSNECVVLMIYDDLYL